MDNKINDLSRKTCLGQCTRKEIREALNQGNYKIALIPAGSTEQHNEHLPFLHDTLSAEVISKELAIKLYPNIIITPSISIGNSDGDTVNWMEHKGTLALRPETFIKVIYDVCHSLTRHGIVNIFIMIGHYGNIAPLKPHIEEFKQKLRADIRIISYWDAYTPEVIKTYSRSGKHISHAAELETSIGLAAFPELVQIDAISNEYRKPDGIPEHERCDKWDMDGHYESRLASAETGHELIRISVDWIAKIAEPILEQKNI